VAIVNPDPAAEVLAATASVIDGAAAALDRFRRACAVSNAVLSDDLTRMVRLVVALPDEAVDDATRAGLLGTADAMQAAAGLVRQVIDCIPGGNS
jgi:hypothetical protein